MQAQRAGGSGTRIRADTLSQLSLVVFPSEDSWTKPCRRTISVTPVPSVEQRNRVLRNTYWLLALSMVPTVLGAWIGVVDRHHERRWASA